MADIAASGAAGRDEHFLRRSFDVARRATSHGNHPFGAILVGADGSVLLEAENGYMPAHDGPAHAERLLATEACRTLAREERASATLYSSAEPCAMCAGAIVLARVPRVVYGTTDPKAGAAGSVLDVLQEPRLNHRPQVTKDVLQPECAALLKDFFATKRRRPLPSDVAHPEGCEIG